MISIIRPTPFWMISVGVNKMLDTIVSRNCAPPLGKVCIVAKISMFFLASSPEKAYVHRPRRCRRRWRDRPLLLPPICLIKELLPGRTGVADGVEFTPPASRCSTTASNTSATRGRSQLPRNVSVVPARAASWPDRRFVMGSPATGAVITSLPTSSPSTTSPSKMGICSADSAR